MGGAVAGTVISSFDIHDQHDINSWSLDQFVPGFHCARGNLNDAVCVDLGRTLAILHTIPVAGYGPPCLDSSGRIFGPETLAITGLDARFENPLPEGTALGKHPGACFAPQIVDRLAAKLDQIRELLKNRPGVICHGDLHERQFICNQSGLCALIDFGDATIADRIWDLASLRYFHGRDILTKVVEAYTRNSAEKSELCNDAELFSIGIAMHHAARSVYPGKSHRLRVATDYLLRTI
jgi:Ser/Thr protein kinase RdoA (MazF antagonist)